MTWVIKLKAHSPIITNINARGRYNSQDVTPCQATVKSDMQLTHFSPLLYYLWYVIGLLVHARQGS